MKFKSISMRVKFLSCIIETEYFILRKEKKNVFHRIKIEPSFGTTYSIFLHFPFEKRKNSL